MRALPLLVVASLLVMSVPAQATSFTTPEEVCVRTYWSQLAQDHCAGLDETIETQAQVIHVVTEYTMQAVQCASIQFGPTIVVEVYVQQCADYFLGLRPVQATTQTIDITPIHVDLNSDGARACDLLGSLCPLISTPAVCPAWGCEPLVDPCLALVDVCADTNGVHAEVEQMGLADIDQDGRYDGFAVKDTRGAWRVVEAAGCELPPVSIYQSARICH